MIIETVPVGRERRSNPFLTMDDVWQGTEKLGKTCRLLKKSRCKAAGRRNPERTGRGVWRYKAFPGDCGRT